MKEISHASLPLAAAISPELEYSTSCSGTRSFSAAALASSTVTPRGLLVAGSRVVQKAEAAGPTPIATRSDPVGAISRTSAALAPRAPATRIIRVRATAFSLGGDMLRFQKPKLAAR